MTSDAEHHPAPARRGRARLSVSVALALGLSLSLAGCKTAAERADEYYQSGLELLEQGDPDRAILQFRNVFNEDGTHYEARKTLADLYRDQGRSREAYSQYLRLAEQYPDDLSTRIALARLAFDTNQQDEFERHATRAQELAPQDPDVQAIDLARRYSTTRQTGETRGLDEVAAAASDLLDSRPDDVLLLGILLDQAAQQGRLEQAGPLIDRLIALQPDNRLRYQQRLAWLVEQGDTAGIETHLRATIERFPEDTEARSDLIRFYVSQERPADAEAYLRELADAAPEDDPTPRVDLIRYIEVTRGEDAARAETETALASGGDPLVFDQILAGFDFRDGNPEAAIQRLRDRLATVETPSQRSRDMQVQLARILESTGQQAEARDLIAEVSSQDQANLGALKMQARWDIQEDRVDEALLDLRAVLDQAPRDVEAMSLMADAYYRAGEADLMRDYLAQAAAASNNAPAETLRFARTLLGEGRHRPAEDALLPALRNQPENVELLALLGQVYLEMPDLPRAQGVIDRLNEVGGPQALAAARQLELAQVSRQGGQQAAMDYLEELAAEGDATLAAQLGLMQARLGANDLDGAQALLDRLVSDQPDDPLVRQAQAVMAAAKGDTDEARRILDTLIAADPANSAAHMMRLRLVSQSQDDAATMTVLDSSLAQMLDNPDLLWAKAGLLERTGDVAGAVAIFERLYVQDSDSIIVANNLASLLATHYADDPERLGRATAVARRLRDTTVPPFMDTYGWLLHLNGDSEAALPYLQGAAEALPDDGAVQLHLGIVQAALGRTDEAEAQLVRGLEMAGDQQGSTVATARATLESLRNPQPDPDQADAATPEVSGTN